RVTIGRDIAQTQMIADIPFGDIGYAPVVAAKARRDGRRGRTWSKCLLVGQCELQRAIVAGEGSRAGGCAISDKIGIAGGLELLLERRDGKILKSRKLHWICRDRGQLVAGAVRAVPTAIIDEIILEVGARVKQQSDSNAFIVDVVGANAE